uniref:Phosphatidic acid phosphatase type 2/haloperoxidase domain-containing protein n=1 Tax=Setaria italica TaxID=4555 RepID=K3YZP7_SETIT
SAIHPNPGSSLIPLPRSRRDAPFLHWLSSRRSSVSRSPVAAPRTMPCSLLPAPSPRPCLIASLRRPPHCKDRFLLPRTRRRPRLRLGYVRMAEMARVGSGEVSSPEVGVSVESDPMLGGEESLGPRREASRWAPVEAALNRMSKWLVAGCFAFVALWKHDAEVIWILLGAVTNSLLSVVLKKLLNHERPSALRSDPGMPSSHAQSIFYGATILVLS